MRAVRFLLAVGLTVLTARQLAYALAPRPTLTAVELQHAVGGPGLVVTALVLGSLSLAVACAVLWLASMGVREQHALSGKAGPAPRLSVARATMDAVALGVASSLACASLESYLHWRAGLGFHGLHCLVGPVHRDAIPILGAFSLVAAALRAALHHVLEWMRRTVELLGTRGRTWPSPSPLHFRETKVSIRRLLTYGLRARGPPKSAVPVHP